MKYPYDRLHHSAVAAPDRQKFRCSLLSHPYLHLVSSCFHSCSVRSLYAGLILERRSPREVYAIGSVASGLGLGFVSLAIGKVREVDQRD